MRVRGLSLVLFSLIAASACDLEVGPGQEVVLGDRGRALGFNRPNAVSVLPGGSLVVQDADVLGRGVVVSAELPETRFVPGAGIVATGGRVRVVQGLVSGGNALLVSENAVQRVVTLAPALEARAGSTVEILGGTLTSSGAFLASGVTGTSTRFDSAELLPEVVSVADSVVRVEGGTLRGGPRERAVTTTLGATRSTVEITGGDFDDEGALISFVLLRGSRSTIRGGRFDTLVLVPAGPRMPMSPVDPLVPGCTEIRGGSFDDLNVVGNGERVIVFGTDFNRPLGPLPTGPDTMTPVSGILEAGNAVAFDANLAGGTLVSLAAPGSPGCP